jgi:hypothetical protein
MFAFPVEIAELQKSVRQWQILLPCTSSSQPSDLPLSGPQFRVTIPALLTFSMQLWKRNSKTLIDFYPERNCMFR